MSASSPFTVANRHALASILEAAETRSIMSATDIFDAQGIKLWAARQPVTAELQRKLADRRLREPLERSLVVEDGVSAAQLTAALQSLLEGPSPLRPMLIPQATRLLREVAQLQIQPAAQLLLTATQVARPAAFDHAVAAMALNGALAATAGGDTPEIRTALLAGLLHDLGDMYIAPEYGEADADRELDFTSYQQLVVHPHVGSLIIKQLTTYAGVVAQAVAEHHERLDGSGYPRALPQHELSPQGRLLQVTEAALNALRDPSAPLLHASVALRVVPGEFDEQWVGFISSAASAQPPVDAAMEPADIQARRGALDALLQDAEIHAAELQQQAVQPGLKHALELASFLLTRVRVGWNDSGLWSAEQAPDVNAAEVEAVEDELYHRLRGVQRAALMRAGPLPPEEAHKLATFCDGLGMGSA